ncbi:MAG TPA: hypothetical protein VJ781_05160 [Pyrinomonadaceae bacterium]|nr:hypothetical protein [Pyrinomonadaceae bacterium]
MKKLAIILSLVVVMSVQAISGQGSNITKTDLSQAEIDRIIAKFTQNESLFRQALNIYAFTRDATIQTIGMGGQITGVYKRDSFMTFNAAGERFEKILYAPVSTMTEITITTEDIDNLGGINPFAIEPRMVNEYNFTYVGKEKIDELDLYVFDVGPKGKPDPKKGEGKYFQGRIWVDDRDLMIVKSKGKAVPEDKQRFPTVDTIRENIDGKYWFPAYATADDELVFDKGQVVKIRMKVLYKDYRVGRTDVTIVSEEPAPDEPKTKPSPTPTPKKP